MKARLLLLSLPLAAAPAVADPAPTVAVIAADVRFDPREGDGSRFVLKGDLTGGTALASYDPATTPLRITLGPITFFDGPPWHEEDTGLRTRWTADSVRLEFRAPRGQRGRTVWTVLPASGLFTLRATGIPASLAEALADGGPEGVAFEMRVGEDVYATSLDFEVKGDRKWSYRAPPSSPSPPPGGGSGGGGVATLAQGEWSGITSLRFEVVRDESAWAALWQEHEPGGTPPAVNFSSEMVVGFWLGARPTGGYSVDIFRMTAPYPVVVGGWCPPPTDPPIGAPCFGGTQVDGFLVEARETQPGPACVVPQAVSYPFHIVRVPRVEGPGVYGHYLSTRNCP